MHEIMLRLKYCWIVLRYGIPSITLRDPSSIVRNCEIQRVPIYIAPLATPSANTPVNAPNIYLNTIHGPLPKGLAVINHEPLLDLSNEK